VRAPRETVAALTPTPADFQGPGKGSGELASAPHPNGQPAACKNPAGTSQSRRGGCTQCQGTEHGTLASPAGSIRQRTPARSQRSARSSPAAPNGSPVPATPTPRGTAPYLLVQPQELAVTHSAVQHPVHVDVVGLRGETPSDPRSHRTEGPRGSPGSGNAPEDPARGRWGTPSPPLLPAELSPCPGKRRTQLALSPALRQAGHRCRSWVCLAGTGPSPEAPVPAARRRPPGPPPHTALEHAAPALVGLGTSRGCTPAAWGEAGPTQPEAALRRNACNEQPRAGTAAAPSTARTRSGLLPAAKGYVSPRKDGSNTQDSHRQVQRQHCKVSVRCSSKTRQCRCRHGQNCSASTSTSNGCVRWAPGRCNAAAAQPRGEYGATLQPRGHGYPKVSRQGHLSPQQGDEAASSCSPFCRPQDTFGGASTATQQPAVTRAALKPAEREPGVQLQRGAWLGHPHHQSPRAWVSSIATASGLLPPALPACPRTTTTHPSTAGAPAA